jgi:hypothetical protein
VWDATSFTKNRERLQRGDVLQKFMAKLLDHPQVKPLLSDEHFSVDGTLIEAWASHKSSNGMAERRASEVMLKRKARRRGRRITVGEDKAYDSRDHVTVLRRMNVTPHVAQNDALTKTGRTFEQQRACADP